MLNDSKDLRLPNSGRPQSSKIFSIVVLGFFFLHEIYRSRGRPCATIVIFAIEVKKKMSK
jgi:hypothetical protein